MHNMHNIQNMKNKTWSSGTFVFLQHRNIGTFMCFHPSVGTTCWYKVIQGGTTVVVQALGGTRWYMTWKVQAMVHGGTWRYMAVQASVKSYIGSGAEPVDGARSRDHYSLKRWRERLADPA